MSSSRIRPARRSGIAPSSPWPTLIHTARWAGTHSSSTPLLASRLPTPHTRCSASAKSNGSNPDVESTTTTAISAPVAASSALISLLIVATAAALRRCDGSATQVPCWTRGLGTQATRARCAAVPWVNTTASAKPMARVTVDRKVPQSGQRCNGVDRCSAVVSGRSRRRGRYAFAASAPAAAFSAASVSASIA